MEHAIRQAIEQTTEQAMEQTMQHADHGQADGNGRPRCCQGRPLRRVGCAHNARRQVLFGDRTGRTRTGAVSYRSGDLITLRCGEGCPDLVLYVRSQRPED